MGKEVKLWGHQSRGLNDVWRLLQRGHKRICVTSPTGGGKTRCMTELVRYACSQNEKVALYTNRVMLTEQTSRMLNKHDVDHGIRASGFNPQLLRDAQICSLMTEYSRVIRSQKWGLHEANLVLVDEAHAQKAKVAQQVISRHVDAGAALVGFTATPIAIGHMYEDLVIAGTTPELMREGVLLPCLTYGPDEPDLRHVGRVATGEYNQNDVRRVIHKQALYGRVIKWWKKLNPQCLPTILFAPGIPESKWFVTQFENDGITAAHIDGKNIFQNGKDYKSTAKARRSLLEASKSGEIKIVSNRFVLREGIDAPWLYHCIMATPFGSLTQFLQAGGRLLRSHEGMDHVVLQDHGGSWFSHGCLNDERDWKLEDDEYTIRERSRKPGEKPPLRCPICTAIREAGKSCPQCGYEFTARWRAVLQSDGSLKQMRAEEFHEAATKGRLQVSAEQKLWNSCYYATLNGPSGGKKTMRQVAIYFKHRCGRWPKQGLMGMPQSKAEWNMPAHVFREIRRRT